MAKLPVAIGLSLCEQVIVEAKTHNVTLVNCFTRRTLEHYPAITSFTAFALLTGGLGKITLDLVVESLDALDEIYRLSLLASFAGPLQTLRCKVRVRDCIFPEPGHYVVSLHAGGDVIAERKLQLL